MAKSFLRRGISGRRLLEFAAGEYHEKYVPESPFITNPLLKKAKKAALQKTPGKPHVSYSNISAEGQGALDIIKKQHSIEKNREVEKLRSSPLISAGLKHRKYGVPILSPDIKQAMAHHDTTLAEMKARHLERENEVVRAHGGGVHIQYVPPGHRLRGKGAMEPTLHPAWVDYAVNINERGVHKEHLERIARMKEEHETTPFTGDIEKARKTSQSKLAAAKTQYRKEILSNKTPWKGYKSELMGSRRRARQTMAEELGYKISSAGKIEVTGKRQIIQAGRKLEGKMKPTSPEFWKKLEQSKYANAPQDPYASLPLGTRPREQQAFLPRGPRRSVGLAGAGPEQKAAYGGEMKRVESNLSRLVGERQAESVGEAAKLKTNLQSRAYQNLAKLNPEAKHAELVSRREEAVNKVLHGTADPRRGTFSPIEGKELATHAGTLGVSTRQAQKLRTQYQNLANVSEAAEKKVRKSVLATGEPWMEHAAPLVAPTGPKYPHLKKVGIGVGIGAGVLGAGYLAHKWLKNRRKETEEARMASLGKLIYFATRSRTETQRTVLAKDRYQKQIKRADLGHAISNYIRAAGAGAGLGYLLKGKMPAGRALKIGAVGGLGAEAVTRAYTASTKDPFGERPWQSKEVDKAPWEAGAAIGGGILIKRHAPRAWKTITKFDVKNPEEKAHPLHDVTTGALEGGVGVLATDRLIRRFAPETAGTGKKLLIGAGVGGVATGTIGYGLSKLVEKRIIERRKQRANQQRNLRNLESRIHAIQFAMSEEEKDRNRQIRRWSGGGLKARGEDIYTGLGRGYRFTRDIRNTVAGRPSLDSRGRERKKEWQKPWFYKKLALGAITAGLGGAALYKTKGGQSLLSKLGDNPVGKFVGGVKSELGQLRESTKPLTGTAAIKAHKSEVAANAAEAARQREEVRKTLGMRSKIRPIRFAETLDYWDVRDYSPRQAVVTAPGGQRRYRRKKKLTETKDFREALAIAGVATAGALGWGAHTWKNKRVPGGTAPAAPVAEQLHLPMAESVTKRAAMWTKEGLLKPKIHFTSQGKIIRFEDKKKRDYVSPAVGVATGTGGLFAGGLYRGQKLKEGEDLTGRRVTRPHSMFPLLQHEGIGTGGGKIAQVHHTPEMGDHGIVTSVSQAQFGKGKSIRVLDTAISAEAAKRARAGVGKQIPYSLFYNNCQRFGGCARLGRNKLIPRQLRTALITGGAAAAGGFGTSKFIRSKRRELSNRNRLIRFKAKESEQRGSLLRKAAIVGGLGTAAAGVATFPGARMMLRIARRDIVRNTQTKLAATRGLQGIFKTPGADPHKGGRMVYDYIDASQRLLNKGVKGKAVGHVLRKGITEPETFTGRVSNTIFPGHFGPGHFARFRGSHLEALKHWDFEHAKMLEWKQAPRVHPKTGRTITPRPEAVAMYQGLQKKQELGRSKAWGELNDALHNKGMNEAEALHHVTTTSRDPDVHDYFNQLAGSKEKAAKKYAKLSLVSPGLVAGGGGVAATGAFVGRRKEEK